MQLTICFPTSKSQRLLIGFIEVIIVYINGTLFGLSTKRDLIVSTMTFQHRCLPSRIRAKQECYHYGSNKNLSSESTQVGQSEQTIDCFSEQ